MAGHPTIGTTFALARAGVIERGREQFVFGCGIGPVPVALTWKGDDLGFAWMTQPLPTFGEPIADDPARTAAALVAVAGGGRRHRPAGPGRVVRRAVSLRAARRRAARWTTRSSTAPRSTTLLQRDQDSARTACSCSRRSPATRARRSTAACSRPSSASSRIRRPAAPAVRSAAIWCGTRSCRPDKADAMLSLQGVKMGRPSHVHISIGVDEGRDQQRPRRRRGGAGRRRLRCTCNLELRELQNSEVRTVDPALDGRLITHVESQGADMSIDVCGRGSCRRRPVAQVDLSKAPSCGSPAR